MKKLSIWDSWDDVIDPFTDALTNLLGDAYYKSPYVKEEKNEYVFKAEIPGVKEKDLEITFERGSIKLSFPDRRDPEYIQSIKSYVGENVNEDEIKATLEDGILKVILPKKNSSSVKTIKISKV